MPIFMVFNDDSYISREWMMNHFTYAIGENLEHIYYFSQFIRKPMGKISYI